MKRTIIFIVFLLFLVISVSGQPWIEVVSPNGGESWQIGSTPTVIWEHSDNFTVFHIQLSRNNGETWEYLEDGIPGTANSWVWQTGVTGPVSELCKIKVIGIHNSLEFHDISNAPFTIYAGGEHWIEVEYPNGGEVWSIGSTPGIEWAHSKGFSGFHILLSRNNGEDWEALADGIPGFANSWIWETGVTGPRYR